MINPSLVVPVLVLGALVTVFSQELPNPAPRPLELKQFKALTFTEARPQSLSELPGGDLLLTATLPESVVTQLGPDGTSRWATEFSDFSLFSLAQSTAGQWLLAGVVEPSGPGSNSSALVWIDANGKELRRRVVGGGLPVHESGYCDCDLTYDLVSAADGGFLLIGASTLGPGGPKESPRYGALDGWILKVDHEGNREWDRSFGGSGYDILLRGAQLPDGGYVLAGFSSSPADGSRTVASAAYAFWLIGIDATGHQVWEKSFNGAAEFPAGLNEFRVARNGDFLLTGRKTEAGLQTLLIRADPTGATRWVRTYGSSSFESPSSLKEMPDGRLLLASSVENTIPGRPAATATLLRCLAADGAELWEKRIPGTGGPNIEAEVLLATDGNFWFVTRDTQHLVLGQLAPETVPAAGETLFIQSLPEFRPSHSNGYFSINGPAQTRFVLETSLDLNGWTPVSTNRLESADLKFSSPSGGPEAGRFFRTRPVQ